MEIVMSIATTTPSTFHPWSEERSNRPDRARIRARIGGLHCSLCTGTIEKALGRQPGVDKVAVSLTHEQDLVREGRRFLAATAFSLIAVALIAHGLGIAALTLQAVVFASLLGLVFLVLSARGLWAAIGGTVLLTAGAIGVIFLKQQGWFAEATPWIVAALAFGLVFGIGQHIFVMAVQALRRGILNQHVLLEIGAFAGIAGGIIGLILDRPGYPTAPFFAVSVMVATYHIFSEWLSLIVKTRSSQAVKRLLDLQPET